MSYIKEFEYKVHNYIKENDMLLKDDSIVVGVSGGADSMCLLNILINMIDLYNLELHVVHIHHGIRGEAADKDEDFVRNYCLGINKRIKYHSYTYDIPNMAKEAKMSEEEMGRIARYESFDKVMNEYKANKIAIAHNLNDNVETVLFNICRGTGISGIKGIVQKTEKIIRPLLCVTREEIELYMQALGQEYRQDQTNFEEDYTRNRIRINVIPYLEKHINEQVKEHINSLSRIAYDTEQFMLVYTDKIYDKVVIHDSSQDKYIINVEMLNKEERIIRQRIIRKCIYNLVGKLKDISNIHIDDILKLSDKNVGKYVVLPYDIMCKKSYDSLDICRKSDDRLDSTYNSLYEEIELGKEYYLSYYDKYITFECVDYEKCMEIPKKNYTKWFDYDKINDIVVLRNRQVGDKMKLNPEGTTKKLKDLMIDLKINKEERDSIPLVAHGNDVLWLIGIRNSEAYRVSDTTKRVLQIKVY